MGLLSCSSPPFRGYPKGNAKLPLDTNILALLLPAWEAWRVLLHFETWMSPEGNKQMLELSGPLQHL